MQHFYTPDDLKTHSRKAAGNLIKSKYATLWKIYTDSVVLKRRGREDEDAKWTPAVETYKFIINYSKRKDLHWFNLLKIINYKKIMFAISKGLKYWNYSLNI